MLTPCGEEALAPHGPLRWVVAVALLDADQRVLLTERPVGKSMAGYLEFPGGKIEAGETPEQALVRELEEEISIRTFPSCLAPLSFISHSYPDKHTVVLLYICRKWEGMVVPREGQTCRWFRINDIPRDKLLEANRPLLAMLREWV